MKYINMRYYSNRNINLGLVACCNKGDKYGILYGTQKVQKEQFFVNKLLYFEKDAELVLAQNSLVSFLENEYNGSAKVDNVYPVSSLVRCHDNRVTRRDDGELHDDKTWGLINDGIPHFEHQARRHLCIYYPIITHDKCTIWYGYIYDLDIFEMYEELTTINYSGWPTLEETTKAVIKFKEQIDSINAFEIMDKFKIMKIGSYISRPGKDDHYYEYLCQSLPYDEKYLSYLLPNKKEVLYYDNNASRRDGYREGVLLMEEETKHAIDFAKEEYSKEKHLAFLINDYFSDVLKKKERTEFLNKRISEKFGVEEARKIVSKFNGNITDEIIALINDHNKSIKIASS